MAIVQLKSTNPKFSFFIKHPENGIVLRSVHKGLAYGWYTDESTYNVYFKDADNDISYKRDENESFEYLNVSRYNTPLFPLDALSEFFSISSREQDEQDVEGYEHICYINLIYIEKISYINFFEEHLQDYTFAAEPQAHKSYSLTITTRKSLHHLLHVASLLCLFLARHGKESIDMDSILDKHLRSIQVVDPSYNFRSVFIKMILFNQELFKKYRTEIEKGSRYYIRFGIGTVWMQRRSFIRSVIPFDKPILDIGCGEGFFAIPFAQKIKGRYYAVDINDKLLKVVKRKAKAKHINNIVTFQSINHFLKSYKGEQVDVILTEVIEHMSEKKAEELIRQICSKVNFDCLIITTPNADFNHYYELDKFRDEDHKWEMGQDAFMQWFALVVQGMELDYKFFGVGDEVEGIQTSQGVIVQRKEA